MVRGAAEGGIRKCVCPLCRRSLALVDGALSPVNTPGNAPPNYGAKSPVYQTRCGRDDRGTMGNIAFECHI